MSSFVCIPTIPYTLVVLIDGGGKSQECGEKAPDNQPKLIGVMVYSCHFVKVAGVYAPMVDRIANIVKAVLLGLSLKASPEVFRCLVRKAQRKRMRGLSFQTGIDDFVVARGDILGFNLVATWAEEVIDLLLLLGSAEFRRRAQFAGRFYKALKGIPHARIDIECVVISPIHPGPARLAYPVESGS